jgi:photosystem II stability/assembly factor-like uncharacterized protein
MYINHKGWLGTDRTVLEQFLPQSIAGLRKEKLIMLRLIFCVVLISTILFQSAPAQNGWTVHGSNLASVYCIKAVDENVAWIAGDSGRVSLTTDGGNTWNAVGGGAIGTAIVWNIEAINASVAFATITPSSTTYIYRTTNGGTSWSVVFSQTSGFVNDLRMIDASNGIAYGDPVGGKWTVLKTTDGGGSWARLPNEPTSSGGEFGLYYNSLSVVGTAHIWFSTTSNRVYRSTDGGETWSFGTLPTTGSMSVWFNTIDVGLVTSSQTAGARTTDSGQTWTGVALIGSGTPYSLAGAGATDFWYASDQIYRSTDRGNSWTLELSALHQWLVLDFVTIGNSAVGYAASSDGTIARYAGPVTALDRTTESIPSHYALNQNYPNPFNPSTTIRFQLPRSQHVTLTVYNAIGERVETLISQTLRVGAYSIEWDAKHRPSGVYFYRLETGGYTETKKMIVIR